QPRPLHTEKAVDVTNCVPPTHSTAPEGEKCFENGNTQQLLTKCDLFTVSTVQTNSEYTASADGTSFVSVLFTAGNGEIVCGEEEFPIKKGDSFFIAANSGTFSVKGKTEFIETRV
ncbi:MAG: mannose-6-phosphate isomerase, partial [Candidatus Fimenecus sp.]